MNDTEQATQGIADQNITESIAPKAEIRQVTKEPVRIGRPPKYKTPEELNAKIEEYFNHGIPHKQVIIGKGSNKQIKLVPTPTITGLALFLGFSDVNSMYDYKARKEFSGSIKRATTLVAQHYEEQLQSGVVVGSIFWLKCHGWHDRQPDGPSSVDEFGRLMEAVQSKANGLPIIEAPNQLPNGAKPVNSVEVTSPDGPETQKHIENTGVL
jgi:hypothetical protein